MQDNASTAIITVPARFRIFHVCTEFLDLMPACYVLAILFLSAGFGNIWPNHLGWIDHALEFLFGHKTQFEGGFL